MALKKSKKKARSKVKAKTKSKTKSKTRVKTKKKAKVKTTVKKKTVKAKPKAKKTKPKIKKGTAKKTVKSAKKKTAQKKTSKRLSTREKAVQRIRETLVNQREQLISDAESALQNELPGQILFPDMGDQASAEIDRNFMLRLKGREQKLITKIEDVLEAIDEGSYGICESCGSRIEVKRLEARPVTSMCIECKTEQEEEERLRE